MMARSYKHAPNSEALMKTVVKACVYEKADVLETLLVRGKITANMNIPFTIIENLEKYFQYRRGKKLTRATPLQVSAKLGSPQCMRVLIRHGAELDIDVPYFSPMTILCRSLPKSPEFMGRFGQCITILVNAGADLHHLCANAGNFIDEYSILHLLVRNGMDPKVVEIVVSHGVRLNFPDFNGCVPLHYAATLQGRVVAPYVEALLKLGANPNKQDSNGKSPMLLFAECQDSELALARMYERSGNPSIADKNGQNALHLACKQLKLRNISFLVEKIADVNSKDLEHKTAADLLFFNINQWRAGYNESDLISCVMKLLGHGGIVSIGVVQHQLIQYLRINDQNFHLPYPLAILDMVVNIHPFINLCSVKHKLAHLNHTLPDDVRRFFERLCSWNGPRSLQHLSRCVIRKCLGRRCGEAVHRLSLPKELHAYLSLCYNPDVN